MSHSRLILFTCLSTLTTELKIEFIIIILSWKEECRETSEAVVCMHKLKIRNTHSHKIISLHPCYHKTPTLQGEDDLHYSILLLAGIEYQSA